MLHTQYKNAAAVVNMSYIILPALLFFWTDAFDSRILYQDQK